MRTVSELRFPATLRAPPDEDDRVLAARLRAGDGAAFETLFHRHYQQLNAFAAALLRSPEAAEDVVVEVFSRLWERRAEWELRGSARSYLYGAVRNEALALLRRQRMVERAHAGAASAEQIPGMGDAAPAADVEVQRRELSEAMERAIAALPERGREAFLLHRRHGLSYAEVAAAMEISPRTVEVHISRAFRALRDQLAPFLPLLLLGVLR